MLSYFWHVRLLHLPRLRVTMALIHFSPSQFRKWIISLFIIINVTFSLSPLRVECNEFVPVQVIVLDAVIQSTYNIRVAGHVFLR